MDNDFATAIGRALERTRAGDPEGATLLIQGALGRGAGPGARPRRPLGQVIDSLVSGRRMARPSGIATPAVPEGARYESHRHQTAFGARDYRLFLPSGEVGGVVMMLHGCTQTADDFAIGTRMNLVAEAEGLAVIYPEQAKSQNQMACWNWFEPAHQQIGAGEPAILADLASSIAARTGVDEGRIFAAGLSAGGAMAAILAAEYPQVFRAVGVHSGLSAGSARDLPGAYAAMRGQGMAGAALTRPVIVFHGTADTTVAPSNADAIIRAATLTVRQTTIETAAAVGAQRTIHRDSEGRVLVEDWRVTGMGHAWSGGAPEGSHTAPEGPDASTEMARFFLKTVAEDAR